MDGTGRPDANDLQFVFEYPSTGQRRSQDIPSQSVIGMGGQASTSASESLTGDSSEAQNFGGATGYEARDASIQNIGAPEVMAPNSGEHEDTNVALERASAPDAFSIGDSVESNQAPDVAFGAPSARDSNGGWPADDDLDLTQGWNGGFWEFYQGISTLI